MPFILDFPKFRDFVDQDVEFIQPKFDGYLAKMHRAKEGVTVLTKNDKVITPKALACPAVAEVLAKIPKHSILFGELFSTGAATDVPTLLNQGSELLQLRIFAAPVFSTNNWFNANLIEVQRQLEEDWGIPFAETSRYADCTFTREELLEAAVAEKMEGWVLKEKHMKGWYKLKPSKFIDAFVVTVNKSFSANNFGDMKSMTVGIYEQRNGKRLLRIIADVGGGWSKEFRETQPTTAQYKFKVCEIEYDSFMKNRLRFPRFVRWREDKDADQCTWDQI